MNNECEKYKALLMGLMDNELTPEEASEVNSHLIEFKSSLSTICDKVIVSTF